MILNWFTATYCPCIMKTDDSWGILLDEEDFIKYAATDESRRFITSNFSFPSMYSFICFSFTLASWRSLCAISHPSIVTRGFGTQALVLAFCGSVIDKFNPHPHPHPPVIAGKNRTEWQWRGKRNITDGLKRNTPVLCNAGWETDNVRVCQWKGTLGAMMLALNIGSWNRELKSKIGLGYEK